MNFIGGAKWLMKGMREYTRSGYETAVKNFNVKDLDVILTGRKFMITGANSGIGKITALEVARRGGEVHMVCRNKERGESARDEIITETSNQSVHLHIVDLTESKDVIRFIDDFGSNNQNLHVLVNNAGCMVHEKRLNSSGFETNFATNTLAVHILTTRLLPLLQNSTDPRVITVSSAGMLTEKLKTTDIQNEHDKSFDGTKYYAQQKRMQVVMTEEYSKTFTDVHFSSMHPGWSDTAAIREAMPSFYKMLKSRLRTPEQGADTVVWLAVSESAAKQPSGLFFQDRTAVSTHQWSRTESTAEEKAKLMENLNDMVTNICS